jgi:hypothetical protein
VFPRRPLLLRRPLANQIADDHQPGSDPDARLELDGFDIEATDSVDRAQPRSHCPLGIVLMRLWVAEINQYAVAHVPGDEAVEPGDDLGDGAVIRPNDLPQILRVMTGRERGRADQVAEHHRQLPAFGVDLCRCTRSGRRHHNGGNRRAEVGNRVEQLAPVADRGHPDADQVLGG